MVFEPNVLWCCWKGERPDSIGGGRQHLIAEAPNFHVCSFRLPQMENLQLPLTQVLLVEDDHMVETRPNSPQTL